MTGYKATVQEVSKEITVAERIKFKDTSDAIGLDTATQDNFGELVVDIDYYGVLNVHNEKAEGDKDYQQYVFVSTDGTKYVTGSESCWTSFLDIMSELFEAGIKEMPSIKFYRKDSKNYKGKQFLTCSLA